MSFPRAALKRFNDKVDAGNQVTVEIEKGLISPTSSRKNLNFSATGGQKDVTLTLELKNQKMLEQEIRCLLQQRGEQDKRIQALKEEVRKVESKQTAAVREKTSLTSDIASLERQLAELQKAHELLKTKEISYLQISLDGQADLEASKATVAALQERNGSLEEMHQETKAHNEDLDKEMDKFHATIMTNRQTRTGSSSCNSVEAWVCTLSMVDSEGTL